MTTLAAALGALPLAIGFGEGAELRRPLGVAIIGGLIASQVLTLLTTPVVYLLLDKLRRRSADERHLSRGDRCAAQPSTRPPHEHAPRRPCCALLAARSRLLRPAPSAPTTSARHAASPAAFKEAPPTAMRWLPAAPADTLDRGAWWQLFGDPVLDGLAAEVEVVEPERRRGGRRVRAGAGARARAARGAVPGVGARRGARRRSGGGTGAVGAAAATSRLGLDGELGARRLGPRCAPASTGAQASAQASAADLAAARLSAQGELATDYFALREADAEIALLTRPIEGYERALQITQNRYDAGVAQRTDVLQAQTQLATTRADLSRRCGQRARLEHAIAVLVGKAPADFALRAGAVERDACPACRSACRRRCCSAGPTSPRPSARVAAANAQIGIERAAYFPSLGLTARSARPADRCWRPVQRVGQRLVARPVAGADDLRRRRDARQRRRRRGGRDVAVARYRQTVLTAFQGVEDQLRRARAGRAGRRCGARRPPPPTAPSSRC